MGKHAKISQGAVVKAEVDRLTKELHRAREDYMQAPDAPKRWATAEFDKILKTIEREVPRP